MSFVTRPNPLALSFVKRTTGREATTQQCDQPPSGAMTSLESRRLSGEGPKATTELVLSFPVGVVSPLKAEALLQMRGHAGLQTFNVRLTRRPSYSDQRTAVLARFPRSVSSAECHRLKAKCPEADQPLDLGQDRGGVCEQRGVQCEHERIGTRTGRPAGSLLPSRRYAPFLQGPRGRQRPPGAGGRQGSGLTLQREVTSATDPGWGAGAVPPCVDSPLMHKDTRARVGDMQGVPG